MKCPLNSTNFPEKIMRKAWDNICEPEVKEAFAEDGSGHDVAF